MSHRPKRPPKEFYHVKAIKEEEIIVKIMPDEIEKLIHQGDLPIKVMIKGIRSKLKREWGLYSTDYYERGKWYRDNGERWDMSVRSMTESETQILETLETLEQLVLSKALRGD